MKKIAFIILSSLMMSSCTDMDLIPESNLSPENFFKSEEDATAAVYGTYSVFTDNDIYNQFHMKNRRSKRRQTEAKVSVIKY